MADVEAKPKDSVEEANGGAEEVVQQRVESSNGASAADQSVSDERRTVFVKGIPQSFTEDQLCSLFQQFGIVESSRVMIDQTNQTLGKGFVTFKTHQEAVVAIEKLNDTKIGEKTISCKISTQRNASSSPLVRSSYGNNLYIRNLAPSTTDNDLRRLFSPFGSILKCRVVCDKQTGASRQIGLVLYERREDAAAALEQMNGKKLEESSLPLAIQFAETETQRVARKNRNSLPHNHTYMPIHAPMMMPNYLPVDMYSMSPPVGFPFDPYAFPEPVFQPIPAPPSAFYPPGAAGPFILPNIHPHPHPHPHPIPIPINHSASSPQHSSDHSSDSNSSPASPSEGGVPLKHVPRIAFQPIPQPIPFASHPIPLVRPRSGSYDTMTEYQYYQNHMSGSPIGSPVFLSPLGSPVQHIFPLMPPMHSQGSTPGSPGHSGDHTPGSPARNRFSHQQPESTNLFVFHLPSNIDDDGLRSLFEKFGKLESVRVITDKESSESRGYGFVKFSSPEDAQTAIKQMNGIQIGNKHLKVSLKTPTPSSSPRMHRYSSTSSSGSSPQLSPSSSPSSSPHSSPGPSPILSRRSSAPIPPHNIYRSHT